MINKSRTLLEQAEDAENMSYQRGAGGEVEGEGFRLDAIRLYREAGCESKAENLEHIWDEPKRD